MKEEYGKFSKKHLAKVKEGILLFNKKKYWECHEVLEDHWLENRTDQVRNVYWAIIQVAASLIHYRDGKLLGAAGMILKAKDKLNKCEQYDVETSLLENYLNWKSFKELVYNIPNDPNLEDFKLLFNFNFPDPYKWEDL